MFKYEMFKDMVERRNQIHSDYYEGIQMAWNEMLTLFQTPEDFDLCADYMLDGMSEDEFLTFTEIIEDVPRECITEKFVDALEYAINKYPVMDPKHPDQIYKDSYERYMLKVFKKELENRKKTN